MTELSYHILTVAPDYRYTPHNMGNRENVERFAAEQMERDGVSAVTVCCVTTENLRFPTLTATKNVGNGAVKMYVTTSDKIAVNVSTIAEGLDVLEALVAEGKTKNFFEF